MQEAEPFSIENQSEDMLSRDRKDHALLNFSFAAGWSPFDLLNVEFSTLDEFPEQYCEFLKQLETSIESKVLDPVQRLLSANKGVHC